MAERSLTTDFRTLVLARPGKPPDAELARMRDNDDLPDALSAEAPLNPKYVDDRHFATIRGPYGALIRRLPYNLAQAIEVFRLAGHYDVVLSWSDVPSILAAAVLRLRRRRPAHVAILMWPSKPKKALPLRLVARDLDRILCWPPVQRRFLEERLRIPPDRFVEVRKPTDTRFWRPMDGAGDGCICAVGQEMRDYGTLLEALRPLDIPCHIAAGSSLFGASDDRWWRNSLTEASMPRHVTVGELSLKDLRKLYARSRFVVVPVLPTDQDNGISTVTEAFGMGRAVIVSDTVGQSRELEHGVNCLRVPVQDPVALREAIVLLWNDPELCERLGASGRRLVEEKFTVEVFAAALVEAAEGAAARRRGG